MELKTTNKMREVILSNDVQTVPIDLVLSLLDAVDVANELINQRDERIKSLENALNIMVERHTLRGAVNATGKAMGF